MRVWWNHHIFQLNNLYPPIFFPIELKEEEFTDDETGHNETKNPHDLPPSRSSAGASADADWGNGTDDACFLEATEDVELAEAVENSLLTSCSSVVDEIPDELIIEVFQE